MLNINKTIEKEQVFVALEGEMDTISTPQLEKELQGFLDDAKEIVFDFEKLNYISSSGLRLLLSIQKKMTGKGTLRILHVNDTIMEVFEMTGFDTILTIE